MLLGEADDLPEHLPGNQPDEDEAVAADSGNAVDDTEGGATSFATQKTVLQAAERVLDLWFQSGDPAPLDLPTFLGEDDRAALHSMAENWGLNHESLGGDGGDDHRFLRISRRAGATAVSPCT